MTRDVARTPRVLHLSPVPFGPEGTFGGGERYPLELAKAMAELAPTTYASFGRHRSATVTPEGLRRVSLPTRRQLDGSALNPVSEQLVPLVAAHDVVHVHQWESVYGNVAVLLARGLGKKVFVTDHGGWARNYRRKLRLHRLVHASLDVSDFAGSFYPEFGDRRATVLGGVDVDRFLPSARPRGRHALFVGRLMPHKGVDVLIRAVDPALPLRLVGRPYDDAYLQHLQGLAQGKDVTFVLDADDEQVLREYQSARCLVLPSLHEPPGSPAAPKAELLGLTLIEAMACGTPAICTATGGMPEVVEDGRSGAVVPPLDEARLREALERLVRGDDDTWEQVATRARERVLERFTWTAVARRCLEAYAAAGPLRLREWVSPSTGSAGSSASS